MNEVRISGILEEVIEHSDSGVAFLSARLRFNRSDEVLLAVVGDAIDRFGPFDAGDAVRVAGRITVAELEAWSSRSDDLAC